MAIVDRDVVVETYEVEPTRTSSNIGVLMIALLVLAVVGITMAFFAINNNNANRKVEEQLRQSAVTEQLSTPAPSAPVVQQVPVQVPVPVQSPPQVIQVPVTHEVKVPVPVYVKEPAAPAPAPAAAPAPAPAPTTSSDANSTPADNASTEVTP